MAKIRSDLSDDLYPFYPWLYLAGDGQCFGDDPVEGPSLAAGLCVDGHWHSAVDLAVDREWTMARAGVFGRRNVGAALAGDLSDALGEEAAGPWVILPY